MIKIPQTVIDRIRSHAENAYPEECCGMILGVQHDGTKNVHQAIAIDNAQTDDRHRRFLISPEQYLDAEKTARGRNLDLLGFYHSHPDHPAAPSQFDAEHALPWFSYIILSVLNTRSEKITSW